MKQQEHGVFLALSVFREALAALVSGELLSREDTADIIQRETGLRGTTPFRRASRVRPFLILSAGHELGRSFQKAEYFQRSPDTPKGRMVEMHTDVALESIFRTGDGVFAVDDEQRIISWNQGAEVILGYTPEEVMGKRCFLIIQGVDESGQVSCIQNCPILSCARQGRLSPGQNLQVRARDGSLLWISVTHTFVALFDSHLAAVVHLFRDATPEVEAKRLLGRMAEQLSGYGSLQGREQWGYSPDTVLTEREKQVLVLLAQGEGTSSIAKKLTISNTTARNHIQNTLAKLGVHTRLEAVAYALGHRLVDPGLVKEKEALEEKL